MTFEELEAFQAFAHTLNFTRAAEAINISQPALHVKIQKLANILEAPLYYKSGRHLSLTPQGEEFARYCAETLAEQKRFRERLHGRTYRQPVTLAAGAGAYLYLLGPAIRAFRKQSDAVLNLVTANREGCLELLRSGRAHLAVTVLNRRPPDLAAEILVSLPCQLVCRADHPLSSRDSLELKDLKGESLIVPPAGRPFRETLESHLKQHKVEWEVALEATGWELMMHFASLGLGTTLVNGCCRTPQGCKAIPVSGLPGADYYLLHPRTTQLAESIDQVKQLIVQKSAKNI